MQKFRKILLWTLYILLCIIVFVVTFFTISSISNSIQEKQAYIRETNNEKLSQLYSNEKCPENYSTDEEKVAEAKRFITDFLASNPQGNITDYAQARIDFLTKNNCTQTLKYIQDNGGIEVYKKTIILNLTGQ